MTVLVNPKQRAEDGARRDACMSYGISDDSISDDSISDDSVSHGVSENPWMPARRVT